MKFFFLDQGEVFGWGNSEYGQLLLDSDSYQVNTPRKLPLNKALGKITDIGATGSACIVLNGKHIKLCYNLHELINYSVQMKVWSLFGVLVFWARALK